MSRVQRAPGDERRRSAAHWKHHRPRCPSRAACPFKRGHWKAPKGSKCSVVFLSWPQYRVQFLLLDYSYYDRIWWWRQFVSFQKTALSKCWCQKIWGPFLGSLYDKDQYIGVCLGAACLWKPLNGPPLKGLLDCP